MGEILVRFEAAQELVLEKLLDLGIFKTKSEAIRAGILELGKEYNMFKSAQELEDELVVKKMKIVSKEIDEGKRKVFTLEQAGKKYGFK